MAFSSSFLVHSYYLCVKGEDILAKHCSFVDRRVMEADCTIKFYKRYKLD